MSESPTTIHVDVTPHVRTLLEDSQDAGEGVLWLFNGVTGHEMMWGATPVDGWLIIEPEE